MKHQAVVSSALAAAMSLGLVSQAQAADAHTEKCYGIAKAGQNDCARKTALTAVPARPKGTKIPANGRRCRRAPAKSWVAS